MLHSSWNSTENVEYKDPLGLYGLQLEFLKSLEITPPLDRWVHVTNVSINHEQTILDK